MMIPAVKTPISPQDVARALRAAWKARFDATPADQQLAVLLAQSALETGHWRSCWCFNLGNLKPGSKWQGDTCQQPRVSEIINGREEFFEPPHPQTTFRAYPSLNAAADDYLWTLRRRFSQSWTPILNGDPIAYSRALKAQGYYTASEARYTAVLKQLFSKYLKVLLGTPPEELPDPEPRELEAVRQSIMVGFDELALAEAAFDAVSAVLDDARNEMTDHDTDPAPALEDDDVT